MNMQSVFEQLSATIESRKTANPRQFVRCQIVSQRRGQHFEKIGEEATEVVIAAKDENREQIVYESADLLFHLMVMLAKYDLTLADVADEWRVVRACPGMEKASRSESIEYVESWRSTTRIKIEVNMSADCIFCKSFLVKSPAGRVYEDDEFVAFRT